MALVMHAANNKNAWKGLIAAEYSGVEVELARNFELGVSNRTPEFIKMNPMGKMPVLETPDGIVTESNTIARYVTCLKPDNPLYGSSLIENAKIEQWVDFAATELDPSIAGWVYPRVGFRPFIQGVEELSISNLKRIMEALNSHLASNTYLVGNSVTLADVVMTCNLHPGFNRVMTKSFTSQYPHVERYYWTLVNQPNFRKVMGEAKQAESILPLPSAQKPAQVAQTKEPEPEVKKVPAKDVSADKQEAPRPKLKNQLDLLPPSRMILDEWKRLVL
ncbi:elongation factor 1-gamma 2-like [Asparagus officinalis]|uniref:elongation factor 1-gamma 2-like n=1 Tax=Asparagus officinalis TaxID=4686 RepID=UPI00098E7DF9|nr:elongation factor 1-gamma 2-like [Asparagus officinalis]